MDGYEGATLDRQTVTERECDVLQLLAFGLSAKEVAQQLEIAPKTVERHIEHLRMKTRTRNRTHMVVLAVSEGLVKAQREMR